MGHTFIRIFEKSLAVAVKSSGEKKAKQEIPLLYLF